MKSFFSFIISRNAAPAAAFVIAGVWIWHRHTTAESFLRFSTNVILCAAVIFFAYKLARRLLQWTLTHFQRHPFWHTAFLPQLDQLFFLSSLLALVLLIPDQRWSLIATACILALLFWRSRVTLTRHPAPEHWLHLHRALFILAFFLFILQSAFQYTAYHYYLLENHTQLTHAVLQRALSMTSAWLVLFSLTSLLFVHTKRSFRSVGVVLWIIVFSASLFIWVINIGILYYSGLYVNPTVFDHAQGAARVIQHGSLSFFIMLLAIVLALFFIVMREVRRAHHATPTRYWLFYHSAILLSATVFLIGFAALQTTPEYVIARSFYQRIMGVDNDIALPKGLQHKLERFGLTYNTDAFAVSRHEHVYTQDAANTPLLPERLQQQPPNILLFFVESFSSRVSSTYNADLPQLTPGFDAMAQHKNTTVFHNYINASTPTMTSIISALCSFLPPTGHGEISHEGKFQQLRLSCLPEYLRTFGGYQHTASITSVDKEYSNKESIFQSMGVGDVYGTEELAAHIAGEPLSWGYSDHQVMPVVQELMEQAPQPFFFSVSTIDSHPPFNISKDVVPYADGTNAMLNMFHTTDDAFATFWTEFQQSALAQNTIVIVTGDHALFPSTLVQQTFPDAATAGELSFYDEMVLLMYVPDTVLPKEVSTFASGIDLTPTLLHLLKIDAPHSFEGHSIFDTRSAYPNLVGMHELGLYINQQHRKTGTRSIDYAVPAQIRCREPEHYAEKYQQLTVCELYHFYQWKRAMLEQGRLWHSM